MDILKPIERISSTEPARPVDGRLPVYQNFEILPGGAESKLEIEALLQHEIWESAQFLSENILTIERTDSGYLVTTSSYKLEFFVEKELNPYLGPPRITVCLAQEGIQDKECEAGSGLQAKDLLQLLVENPNFVWSDPYTIIRMDCKSFEIIVTTSQKQHIISL